MYHGAIQLLADPTGRKLTSEWVGFGRSFELNTGPWALELITTDTSPETISTYTAPPPS